MKKSKKDILCQKFLSISNEIDFLKSIQDDATEDTKLKAKRKLKTLRGQITSTLKQLASENV